MQVVCDKEVGYAKLCLKVLKHIDDLRLNGNVKSADRFVADDKPGIDGKGACDSDALPLSAENSWAYRWRVRH
jgi:hypothetical protein